MKHLNYCSSGSKMESVTCKFTKNCTPSQYFFKEFHYKCRTVMLKNASWWLLLRAALFWKYCWMAASQGQLQRYIYLLSYTYFTFLTVTSWKRGTNFYGFLLGKGFREKCKHTELALIFIQKQYFSPKNPFSCHYNRTATLWISKKLFIKFSFFKGTLRPWRKKM